MQNRLPFQIEIPRRSFACTKGLEPFKVGADYFSVLVDETEGLKRYDFCETCWENGVKEEFLSTAKSSWKSKVPEKKTERDLFQNRDEKILHLLKTSCPSGSFEEEMERFVLAIYLARKKILLLRQELAEENGVIDLYEVAETEEMIAVKKMPWNQIQVNKIQIELAEKLKI